MGEIEKSNEKSAGARVQRHGRWGFIVAVALLVAIGATGKIMIRGFLERNFVFFPVKPLPYSPRNFGMEYEDVYFNTPDGVRLNSWLIRPASDTPMVLWFHGNAGNIASRLENARLLFDRGLSLFMVDYRGYGMSGGVPSEKGIYIDGQAAYDYLTKRGIAGPKQIIIFGRSLGSSVAVYVASRNECAGVILESALTNMGDMAQAIYPIIPGLGVLRSKFNSAGRIASVKAPILFFHGDMDDAVPYEQGRLLFDAATSGKQFYTIRGAHHNDTYIVGGKEYFDTFVGFAHTKTGISKSPE